VYIKWQKLAFNLVNHDYSSF